MYTSGCPKNQNRFSNRNGEPPLGARKNVVDAVRSSASISRAANSIGGPSSISTDVVSMLQTKIGIRFQVRPGARWLRMVAIMLTAFRIIAMPIRANAKM